MRNMCILLLCGVVSMLSAGEVEKEHDQAARQLITITSVVHETLNNLKKDGTLESAKLHSALDYQPNVEGKDRCGKGFYFYADKDFMSIRNMFGLFHVATDMKWKEQADGTLASGAGDEILTKKLGLETLPASCGYIDGRHRWLYPSHEYTITEIDGKKPHNACRPAYVKDDFDFGKTYKTCIDRYKKEQEELQEYHV